MKLTLSSITGNVYGAFGIIGGPLLGLLGVLFLFGEWTWGVPLMIAGGSLFFAGLIALPIFRRGLDAYLNLGFSKYATGGIVAVFSAVSFVSVLLVVVLVLGAALAGPGFEQASSDAWSVSTSNNGQQADGTITLSEGEYGVYTFTTQRNVQISLEIESGAGQRVDVFVMDQREFDRFRDQDTISYHSSLSRENTLGYDEQDTVPAGDYVIVIDNTAFGEAAPGGPVTVGFSFQMD